MEEINDLVKTALDTGIGSYYRKDAIRQLARLHKTAELSQAVLKLLKNIDDPSLQREVMDLAAKFAISEAVNLLLPISLGKGLNARYAINILAKIGGKKAYDTLKSIAMTPGFDLSKTAASRAMEEMRRRQPDIEKEEEEQASAVLDAAEELAKKVNNAAQESLKGISEQVAKAPNVIMEGVTIITGADAKEEEKPEETPTDTSKLGDEIRAKVQEAMAHAKENVGVIKDKKSKKKKDKKSDKPAEVQDTKSFTIPPEAQKELNTLKAQVAGYQRDLAERDSRIKRLQDEVTALKEKPKEDAQKENLQRSVHELREESARMRAAYEKKLAVQNNQIMALEEEAKDAKKQLRRRNKKDPKKGGGCGSFIVFVIIIIFISKFLSSI